MCKLFILLLLSTVTLNNNRVTCDGGQWEYGDQDNWPDTCRNGRMQSPINLPDICYPSSQATTSNSMSNRRRNPSSPNNEFTTTNYGYQGGQGNYGSSGSSSSGNYGNSGNSGNYNHNNNRNSSIRIDPNLRIQLLNYDQPLSREYLKISNNGHTISMKLEGSDDHVNRAAPGVSGSAADGQVYQFVEAHFHWDQQDTTGSEHAIAGKRTALEMHLVHFNVRYGSKKEAASKNDGLLVLGVLFREDTRQNSRMKPITDQISSVRQTNSTSTARQGFSLRSILPSDLSTFYKYHGSLTTPPCYESVTWLLLAQAENIGYNQLSAFQAIEKRGDKLRRLQQTHDRPIYASSDRHCHPEDNDNDHQASGSSGQWGQETTTYRPSGSWGSSNGRPSGQGFENPNRPTGNGQGSGYGNNNNGYGQSGYGGNRPQGQGGYGQSGYGQSGTGQSGNGQSGYGNSNRPNNGGYGYLENGRPQGQNVFGSNRPRPGPGSPWGSNGRPNSVMNFDRPYRSVEVNPIIAAQQVTSELSGDLHSEPSHLVQIPQPVISFEPVLIHV